MLIFVLQAMSHFVLLLSLLLSLQLWPAVSSLRCYKCQSITTPSCKYADRTDGWKTCRDNMCLTAIGFAQIPFFGIRTCFVSTPPPLFLPLPTVIPLEHAPTIDNYLVVSLIQ